MTPWRGIGPCPLQRAVIDHGCIRSTLGQSSELMELQVERLWLFRRDGLPVDIIAAELGFNTDAELLDELWREVRCGRKFSDLALVDMTDTQMVEAEAGDR